MDRAHPSAARPSGHRLGALVVFFAALTVALALLSWLAFRSGSQWHEFDFFIDVRAGALTDAVAHEVERLVAGTEDAARPGDELPASRAALLEQLERVGALDSLTWEGDELLPPLGQTGLPAAVALIDAVIRTGAVTFVTLFDAGGQVLLAAGSRSERDQSFIVVNRAVRVDATQMGALRVAVAAAPLLAAHRSILRHSLLTSLFAAALACIMATAVFARQRAMLCDARRERALTAAVLDGMRDGVAVIDAGGIVQLVNPAACSLLGTPEMDLLGKPCGASPCGALYAQLNSGGNSLETEIRHPAGPPTPVLISALPLPSRVHGPPGTVLLLRDLSETRRLECEKQTNATLASFGRFAATVAHEIRNPLNAIAVGAQRLSLEGMLRDNGNQPQRLLELIHREIERLDHILSDFLDLARPPRLQPLPGDLDALLREMSPLLQEGNPAGVSLHLECGGGTAVFDPGAVRQSIMNLVRNAREAVGTRGNIEIATRQEAECSVVEVRDDGPGIPPENRQRVFEFEFTTKPAGNGLGLAIVHRLVTEMGGRVELDSLEGHGTVVRLLLPRAAGSPVA